MTTDLFGTPIAAIITTSAPRSSPWGAPQQTDHLGEGVWSVSCAGHGGIYVPAAMLAKMPPAFVEASFAGRGWFEEDCDWALVAVAFPHLFSAEHNEIAKRTVSQWHPTLAALAA